MRLNRPGPLRSIWTVRLGGRSRSRLRSTVGGHSARAASPRRSAARVTNACGNAEGSSADGCHRDRRPRCRGLAVQAKASNIRRRRIAGRTDQSPARHRAISSSLALAIRLGVGERAAPRAPRATQRRAPHVRHAPGCSLLPAELIGRYYRRSIGAFGRQLLSHNHPAGLLAFASNSRSCSRTRGLAIDPRRSW